MRKFEDDSMEHRIERRNVLMRDYGCVFSGSEDDCAIVGSVWDTPCGLCDICVAEGVLDYEDAEPRSEFAF